MSEKRKWNYLGNWVLNEMEIVLDLLLLGLWIDIVVVDDDDDDFIFGYVIDGLNLVIIWIVLFCLWLVIGNLVFIIIKFEIF